MMGPAHSTTGLALGLATAYALMGTSAGPSTVPEALTFGAVCAGMAVFPDIDHPSSTVARSFGPASTLLAHAVNGASVLVYNATGGRRDTPQSDGHRTLTHTIAFAAAMGVLTSLLCAASGRVGVAIVLFISLGLAIRGVLADWAKSNGWIGVTAAAAAATYFLVTALGESGFAWIGLAVAIGNLAHMIGGDCLTKEGSPLLWPVPIRGKRWYDICFLPGPLRLETNGIIERAVIVPLAAIAAATLALLIVPQTHDAALSTVSTVGAWSGWPWNW